MIVIEVMLTIMLEQSYVKMLADLIQYRAGVGDLTTAILLVDCYLIFLITQNI